MTIRNLIDRLFEFEEINGDGVVDVHLHRWRLFRFGKGIACYLHHFLGSDWSRDVHDHPKTFVSIGLWGGYVEEYWPAGSKLRRKRFVAPWIRRFPPTHRHRLRITRQRPTWTLVFVGPWRREWGFWTPAGWMEWSVYVRLQRYLRDRRDTQESTA